MLAVASGALLLLFSASASVQVSVSGATAYTGADTSSTTTDTAIDYVTAAEGQALAAAVNANSGAVKTNADAIAAQSGLISDNAGKISAHSGLIAANIVAIATKQNTLTAGDITIGLIASSAVTAEKIASLKNYAVRADFSDVYLKALKLKREDLAQRQSAALQ